MSDPLPSEPRPLHDAKALAVAGRLDEAAALVRRHLADAPQDADAHNLLGALQAQRGDPAESLAHYRRALDLAPGLVKARSNLGAALLALGRIEDADVQLTRACADDPAHAPALVNLGQVRLRQGRTAEAVALLERAAAAAPDDAMNWSNLGAAQVQAGQDLAAADSLRKALAIAPRLVSAWTNLANVFDRLDRPADMLDALERALAVLPQAAELHTARGIALRKLGKYDAAIAAHERALALRPGLSRARFNRALLLLALGRYGDGWRDFQSRPSAVQSGLDVRLLPQNLAGRRILLRSNQGLGDELFFLRFAPELKRRGADVGYVPSAKLASLLRRSAALDVVADREEDAGAADATLLVDDLPYALAADERTIPSPLPLAPLPERVAAMRARLDALGPAPYLGVTWRAGMDALGHLHKSVPPPSLAWALRSAPGTLVSLQRQPQAGEAQAFAAVLGRPLHDFSAVNDDLEDALAVLALLDDYVGVSNTNVHLRASLNRASRVLVQFPPEFRWMATGDESPWFPGHRVYRQTAERDWSPALTRLAADLSG